MDQIEKTQVSLGNGLNFGCDYLGYIGDMKTSHANFIISIKNEKNEKITMDELIRIGRVSANTGKQGVLIDSSGKGISIDWKMRQKIF
ncbi:hypothetical protein ENUP19_0059G0022 [Entamoeba nuttalli]|uniref:tRNA-intron lyase n=1 Tax=Entamoeba nuttalli TaxID=412467 RepID=A0ABQ0DD78_9EUKA